MIGWYAVYTQPHAETKAAENRCVRAILLAGEDPTAVPPQVLAAIREREELGAFDRLDARQSLSLGAGTRNGRRI